jgi:tRNA-dihydrouridine synthase A
VLHGDRDRLLGFSAVERPLALQLGGSDPGELAAAVRAAASYGYDEVNLNVGCPSDRVRSGAFGACLMREPALVADCLAAMIAAAPPGVEITVKHRIGVDGQDPARVLPAFVDRVAAAGVRRFVVHARKAWLDGLSPKENREIPPLDHDLVAALKRDRPGLTIVANGGLADMAAARGRLDAGLDGVMVGRAAYHDPGAMLAPVDRLLFGAPGPDPAPEAVALAMLPYVEAERLRGTPLHRITRHMLGMFAGRPGARVWRRVLSEEGRAPGAGPELVLKALAAVAPAAAAAA